MKDIYIHHKGEKTGPYTMEEVQGMMTSANVTPDSLGWRDGMAQWQPLSAMLVQPETTISTPAEDFAAQASVSYAGFWKRILAYWIDAIILSVVIFPVLNFLLPPMATQETIHWGAVGMFGFGGIIMWLYYALMESSAKQATLGKMALGFRVTDLEGQRINFARASLRYWAMLLSWIILCIGFLMCVWTQRKQCLHDMIGGCLLPNKSRD